MNLRKLRKPAIGCSGLTGLALVALIPLVESGSFSSAFELKERKTGPRPSAAAKPNKIAPLQFAVHDKGLQWLVMANHGEFGNPDGRTITPETEKLFAPGSRKAFPELEYPGGTGTVFFFSGGVWVGAIKGGEKIVSTVTDGDNGTREFGPVTGWLLASKDLSAKEKDDDGDWTPANDLNGDGKPSIDWDGPTADANGDGIFDYDPEPNIDEDPVGDISQDFVDNDFDGLVDEKDPDLDGDKVPGSNDDDGDGKADEDGLGRAGQEWITAYVDTCKTCLDSPDADGFTPLGIRVVQHSYQWS